MFKFKLFAFSVLALALFAGAAPRASAQVSFGINIGPPPGCPYGYFDYALTTAHLTATTVRTGLTAGSLLGPAPGSTAHTAFSATSTPL